MEKRSIIENQLDKISKPSNKFCPVNATIDVLSGKWKMKIMWELRSGKKRFGQLQTSMPSVTPTVLSTQLKALKNEGIVRRQVYAEIPPKVEYELTEIGLSLISVICAMETWGVEYIKSTNSSHNEDCLWNN